jgi:hypothetical protein
VTISSVGNHYHHSKNNTIPPPMTTATPKKKKALKMLQMTHLLGKSPSNSLSAMSSPSTENNDYIVEFEHYHRDHHHHHQGHNRNGTTTSIPPFRIIPPSSLENTLRTSAGTTTWTQNRQSCTTTSSSCSRVDQRMGSGFRLFRTGLRHSKSSTSSQAMHHRVFPLKRRMLPHRFNIALSQSTLQTLNTINSSSSSSSTSGVDEDQTTGHPGPINEYGDCSKDEDLDILVDDANVTPTTTAQMMMDISDQYYCIGKYYQYELCQSQLALQYYFNAYHTAVQCYRNVMSSSTDKAKIVCKNDTLTPSKTKEEEKVTLITTDTTSKNLCMNDDAIAAAAFASSSSSQLLLEEIQGQIQLTKECIGRLHFELGNIDEALEML